MAKAAALLMLLVSERRDSSRRGADARRWRCWPYVFERAVCPNFCRVLYAHFVQWWLCCCGRSWSVGNPVVLRAKCDCSPSFSPPCAPMANRWLIIPLPRFGENWSFFYASQGVVEHARLAYLSGLLAACNCQCGWRWVWLTSQLQAVTSTSNASTSYCLHVIATAVCGWTAELLSSYL